MRSSCIGDFLADDEVFAMAFAGSEDGVVFILSIVVEGETPVMQRTSFARHEL